MKMVAGNNYKYNNNNNEQSINCYKNMKALFNTMMVSVVTHIPFSQHALKAKKRHLHNKKKTKPRLEIDLD